jgi:GxxExxY protein
VEGNIKDIEALNQITESIIGCAIEVHKVLGPGLLESSYERALCHEFDLHNIHFEKQVKIPILYKQISLGDYKIDMIVENEIIAELKAVDRFDKIFEAQLLAYLKITNKKLGLLINFNVHTLKDGIRRIIN